MAELLADSELTDEQRAFVATINHSGGSLLALLNDILDFSKIEAGQLTMESVPFDLERLVFDVADLFRARLEGAPVELLVDFDPATPAQVQGDPGRLRQILNNLVSNAVKFTSAGHILIEVHATPLAEGRMTYQVSVQDTGLGIPPEKQARLFQAFVQADASTSRKYGGTGLGLVLVKRIAEAMGGSVRLESQEGLGTRVSVDLPLEAGVCLEDTRAGGAELTGKRILILDDLALNRKLMGRQLQAHGATTLAAASGTEGLQQIEEALERGEPFDAVLVDLHMPPGMDGATFGKQVRSDPRCRSTALVVLTATGVRGEAAELAALGFDGYLLKPIGGDLLARALVAALHRAAGPPGAALVTRHSVSDKEARPTSELRFPPQTRLLLVEDTEVNQAVARRFLERAGATVVVADNGRIALEKLVAQPFDLILMDCQMPEMDGFEATKQIRALEAGTDRHIPILAMTAHAMVGDRARCLAAGMDDYLTKPISRDELVGGVTQWLPPKEAGALPAQALSAPLPMPTTGFPTPPPELELNLELFQKLWEVFDQDGQEMGTVVIEPFTRRGRELLQTLRQRVAAGDAPGIKAAAHALKGSSRTLALSALGQLAEDLEHGATTSPPETLTALLDQADTAFAAACQFLRAVRGE
jgi:CheY-like chemotaxis protein/anti-sigma regulatory factor (Ser/Thr protein kinase)